MSMTTFQGDTGTPFRFPISLINGVRPNLSGFTNANFTLHLYNAQANPPVLKVCNGGTFSVQTDTDGTNSIVVYQPVAADIDTVGTWTVYLSIIFSNGPKTMNIDTITVNPIH